MPLESNREKICPHQDEGSLSLSFGDSFAQIGRDSGDPTLARRIIADQGDPFERCLP
jgi:hypothetical protein